MINDELGRLNHQDHPEILPHKLKSTYKQSYVSIIFKERQITQKPFPPNFFSRIIQEDS